MSLNLYRWVFCGNKDKKPSGQNIGKTATAYNEYGLRPPL